MSSTQSGESSRLGERRRQLIKELFEAGRESSAATVLFHAAIAAGAGLSASDMKTIDTLSRFGSLTAGELAQRIGLATASVTSLIDRLERKGWVRRVRDPKDRRVVIVEPIRDRAIKADAFFATLRPTFESLADSYSDEQLETILDFLRRSAERTREVTARLGQ